MNMFNDCQWRNKPPKRMSVGVFYDTLWIAFQLQFRESPFAWLIADRWLPFTWRGWFSNRTLKKKSTREIIREIFLVRGQSSTVTEANTAESFTIFIYNENALNNIKSYQNFHKTMTIIFEKRKITLTVHGFKLDLILSPFFERSG